MDIFLLFKTHCLIFFCDRLNLMNSLNLCPCGHDLYFYKGFFGSIHTLPGSKEPQVKGIWTKELGINHLQFRESICTL